MTEDDFKIYDSGSNSFDRYVVLLMNKPDGDCYEAILAGDKPDAWIDGDRLYDREDLGVEIPFKQLPQWVQDRLITNFLRP